jgi:hypothetical protein
MMFRVRALGAFILMVSFVIAASGITACHKKSAPPTFDMNAIAERYVKLVLKVGQHDPDFVDAYYGDDKWKPTGTPQPLDALFTEAQTLWADAQRSPLPPNADDLTKLRRTYLARQISAVESRIAMLSGEKYTFDEEAKLLYDVHPPHKTEVEFSQAIAPLDHLLPGTGALVDRYTAFRAKYVVPKEKLDAVFQAAITACRSRTLAHIALPPEEKFTVEYVTGKSWSAYNWYKGHYTSLIQVNTDLPVTIDRIIDLACHEGYPGHHVYNVLLEKSLVRDRGWIEYSVYPLFSPQSLIAEGTANFGIDVAFPGDARTAFERDTLYPLAGLDPATATDYALVQHIVDQLSYAGNEAARKYLDDEMDRDAATRWLETWAMMPADRAAQRTKFFDQYRSYVINYNLGRDLVRTYIEKHGGTVDAPDVRWREFAKLLSSPRLPSGLQ